MIKLKHLKIVNYILNECSSLGILEIQKVISTACWDGCHFWGGAWTTVDEVRDYLQRLLIRTISEQSTILSTGGFTINHVPKDKTISIVFSDQVLTMEIERITSKNTIVLCRNYKYD